MKSEFGLSYSGDHFFNNSGPSTFYDNDMSDLSMFQTFNDNNDFFSASSSSPQHTSSLDESFMFDSPTSAGSPMDDSVLDIPDVSMQFVPIKSETPVLNSNLFSETPVPNSNLFINLPATTVNNNKISPQIQQQDDKKNRQMKRRRTGTEETSTYEKETKSAKHSNNNNNSSSFTFPSREEILEMSSKEFEGRIEQIEQVHVFSNRELQEIKVYKRLIKNRESAQASRQKKKQIVKELEQKVSELEEENFKLRRSVALTSAENMSLKNEVQVLKSRIPNTNHLIGNTHSLNHVQAIPYMPRNPQLGPSSVRGVMLMVVLLSFGLLVGNVGFPGLKHMSLGTTPTRVFEAAQGQYKPVSNPTLLMDMLSTNSPQSEHLAERLSKKGRECDLNGTEPAACSLSMESVNSMDMRESDSEENENPSISSSTANNHMEEDEVSSSSTSSQGVDNKATSKKEPSVASAAGQETVSAPSPASFDWKPNTTYLMCSTMKHILPPNHISQQFDPGNPQNLTFFILPNDKGKGSKEDNEKVLEITCLMSSMSVLPIESMTSIQSAFH